MKKFSYVFLIKTIFITLFAESCSIAPTPEPTSTATPVSTPTLTSTPSPTDTLIPTLTSTPLPVYSVGEEELQLFRDALDSECKNPTWETIEKCFIQSDEELWDGELSLLVTSRKKKDRWAIGGGAHTSQYNFLMFQKLDKWPADLRRYIYPNIKEANLLNCWLDHNEWSLQQYPWNEVPIAYEHWDVTFIAFIPLSDKAALELSSSGDQEVYFVPSLEETDYKGKLDACIKFQASQPQGHSYWKNP
jgi:hypothetical protein